LSSFSTVPIRNLQITLIHWYNTSSNLCWKSHKPCR